MDDHDYAQVLRDTMEELTAQFAHPTDIGATLHSVTASCVELIDGADSGDVMLISGGERFRSVAATSQLAVDIDRLQERFGEGPCLDAAAGAPMVVCNGLRQEPRWPRFAEAAVGAGVNSALSFQLFTNKKRMGALNLFGTKPKAFTLESRAVGAMFATHAAVALIAEDERLQFRSALASRDIIGQAKGMIMERFHVDAVRAFELLTKLSQDSNTKLADIADELVSHGPEPTSGTSRAPAARRTTLRETT
ncbi:GAF and ANTAR domain-containing protein [Mycobacterium sp. HUMS_1102779]|uniref:GAF and ANTAR domain-containing protein n=1 Tax=Mycobacterium sp. HUMS_1102779 TaxID=3383487 RepID=UPI003899F2AA